MDNQVAVLLRSNWERIESEERLKHEENPEDDEEEQQLGKN